VEEDEVNVIGLEFAQEALDDDVGVGSVGVGDAPGAEPDFGDDLEAVAGDAFESGDEVGMGAVEVGQVEEAGSAFVGFAQECHEFFTAHAGVIGLAVAAPHAGAEGEARGADAGLAQGDGFEGVGVPGLVFGGAEPGTGEGDGAGCEGGATDEFASPHAGEGFAFHLGRRLGLVRRLHGSQSLPQGRAGCNPGIGGCAWAGTRPECPGVCRVVRAGLWI